MTAKANRCDECEWFTFDKTPHPNVCKLGHSPMFHDPKPDPHDSDWGWKLRCDDFKPNVQQ